MTLDKFNNVQNEAFTEGQVKKVSSSLDEIRKYITERFSGLEDKIDTVNETLEYLKESSQRVGRKDWINICLGQVIQMATAVGLSGAQAKGLWQFFVNTVSGVLSLPGK